MKDSIYHTSYLLRVVQPTLQAFIPIYIGSNPIRYVYVVVNGTCTASNSILYSELILLG